MKIHPYIFAGMSRKKQDILSSLSNQEVLRLVCSEFKISYEKIMNNLKSRKREFVQVRQVYFYIKKSITKESLEKIGSFLEKDHATVLHSLTQVNNHLENEKNYSDLVLNIKAKAMVLKNKRTDTNKIMKKIKEKQTVLN